MTVRLVTDRLVIRDVAAADASAVAEIWADEEVTRFLGGPRDRSRVEASVREAAACPPRLDLWTVERDGAVIGSCGLVEKEIAGRGETELVYVIARPHQRRGLATEAGAAVCDHATGTLGLSRLAALIHGENVASVRVAEKLQFRFERDVERGGGRVLQLHVRTA